MDQVVGRLACHDKPTVLGVHPTAAACLQVKSQLIATVRCQLMKQVVAEPEVAPGVLESDLKLRPRTVEGVGSVDVLLDQQRNAISCTTK